MTPENPLEHALIAATTEVAARPTFYRLMLESVLYTVDYSPEARPEGLQTLPPRTQVEIPTIEIDGINPGSRYGKQFDPAEIGAMLTGRAFRPGYSQPIQEDARALLGRPAVYPTHITDALVARFKSMPTVRAAYLAHCAFPAPQHPAHIMIGIEVRDDWERIVQQTMHTVRQVARRDDDIVDVIPIDDSRVSRYMLNETKPFYKRKLFGLF